jgi:predicted transcriptional regulator
VRVVAKSFVRRGRFEIVNEILTLCKEPTQKTHILYRCNLSYDQVRKYLDFLISNNLLEPFSKDGRNYFQTTKKGRKFTEEHKKLGRFLGES